MLGERDELIVQQCPCSPQMSHPFSPLTALVLSLKTFELQPASDGSIGIKKHIF